MTASKGSLQGYNGVASVNKKHQIIIDAQAFGEGQEHHTLQPVVQTIKDRYQRLGISKNIYDDGFIVTADTGFANEANTSTFTKITLMDLYLTINFVAEILNSKTRKQNAENEAIIKKQK